MFMSKRSHIVDQYVVKVLHAGLVRMIISYHLGFGFQVAQPIPDRSPESESRIQSLTGIDPLTS